MKPVENWVYNYPRKGERTLFQDGIVVKSEKTGKAKTVKMKPDEIQQHGTRLKRPPRIPKKRISFA